MEQNPTPLRDIVAEFEGEIPPSELRDILEAVRTLKRGSGWGHIEMVFLGGELNDLNITIKRKPKKQKTV